MQGTDDLSVGTEDEGGDIGEGLSNQPEDEDED